MVRTLGEDQPLRLLLNLHLYHFNRSEPTQKTQSIKLVDVTAASINCECSKLDIDNNLFYFIEMKLLIAGVPWVLAEFHQNRIVESPHENYFNI